MLWLIGQIALFLAIALVIGFILGWFARAAWRSDPGESSAPADEASPPTPQPDDATFALAAALGQRKATAEVKRRFSDSSSQTPDDLQLINGIGPKLSHLLNRMNITTFDQVASFTATDVAMVTAALDSFKDRIVRDDWVGQARNLVRGKE